MSDPINFDIEGLIARYELHPERRDVFVEGDLDQGLIRAFLENQRRSDVVVFCVEVVNVSSHMVLQRGFPHPSRRSEALTLALELEQRGVSSSQVACIADADFDYLLPMRVVCALLLLTDYTSMDLYAFSSDAVHRILLMLSPGTDSTGAGLINDLSGPLQFLFSARAANFNLQLGLAWIDGIDKFFGIQGDRVWFDHGEFMRRYVVDRLPAQMREKFDAKLTEIQSLLTSDIRCRIRGHDFVKILTWYLRTIEKCKYLNEDSVQRMLYLTIRLDELQLQAMFSSLLKRFSTGTTSRAQTT